LVNGLVAPPGVGSRLLRSSVGRWPSSTEAGARLGASGGGPSPTPSPAAAAGTALVAVVVESVGFLSLARLERLCLLRLRLARRRRLRLARRRRLHLA